MFETTITVVGRLVSDPTRRTVGEQDVVKFRLASSARRRTGEGTWESGDSLFLNVNCWGRLVTGVVGSLQKGDAVIVVGNVYTSEYDDRDGNRRSSLEMRAHAVGPDLSRYIVNLKRVENLRDGETQAPESATEDAGPAASDDDGPLSLSA
ncbi:MAG: single-stranded DNA-binding protein [Mycobacterium sp.]|nr:single-stranded DNA-binding protein [Mycobacterium sp.]